MTDEISDFKIVAVTRDLSRRPEIRHLAFVLQKIASTTPVSQDDVAPIFVYQAYRLIEKPELVELLQVTLSVCQKKG